MDFKDRFFGGTQKKKNNSEIAGNSLFGAFFQTKKNKNTKKKEQNHQKHKTNKNTFLQVANTPPLWWISVFQLTLFCFRKAVFCWKHYKIVFSAEHSFCVSQIVKPPFEALPKMALLKPKVPFWVVPVPAETPTFVVFGDFVWLQKEGPFPQNR